MIEHADLDSRSVFSDGDDAAFLQQKDVRAGFQQLFLQFFVLVQPLSPIGQQTGCVCNLQGTVVEPSAVPGQGVLLADAVLIFDCAVGAKRERVALRIRVIGAPGQQRKLKVAPLKSVKEGAAARSGLQPGSKASTVELVGNQGGDMRPGIAGDMVNGQFETIVEFGLIEKAAHLIRLERILRSQPRAIGDSVPARVRTGRIRIVATTDTS